MGCNTNDFMFPMQADVFYPIVEQGAYGNVSKTWSIDRSIICSFTPAGTANKEEVRPNIDLTLDSILIGRVKKDLRVSSKEEGLSITNVVISNIRDQNCNEIYTETAGPRSGKSTIFEIATQQPFVGPFGSIEYYNVILRRSENQAVDV
jgi:hypothetical protein